MLLLTLWTLTLILNTQSNMRTFEITYWVEMNDESTDLSIILEAETLQEVLHNFKELNIVHKRIESIHEKPNNN